MDHILTSKQIRQKQAVLAAAHRDYKKGLNLRSFFKVPDRALSEDLVQETFIRTWRYLVRGGKIDIMKAFLYHVLNNLIIDEYRKRKTISLDALREKGFNPWDNHSEHTLNILDGRAALLLIQGLPDKYKKVMRMRYIQNLSLKEMSLITGQSKNALAVQTHRGLIKLKLIFHQA